MSTEREAEQPSPPSGGVLWVGFVVAALMALELFGPIVYGAAIPAAAAGLYLAVRRRSAGPSRRAAADRQDLLAIGALYLVVVALFRLAFEGFGTDRVAGLFLAFAAGLMLGVGGPLLYTVWHRGRSLASLGLTTARLSVTIGLGVLFAGVQFALTLWGYDLPAAEAWVPLLVMSLVVGAFEAVFFRGFIQGRLEASFGTVPAVAGAAGLYALYHLGYGMAADEMVFLFGLGVVYAIAFRLTRSVLVLWPLLTPLGALYANLEAGDIELPWASIAGFVDVAVAMAVLVWLAHRHQRRRPGQPTGGQAAEPAPARRGHLV
jgi:membrane protease YdiL (CAAX protease family)